jgi:eukaryotic-like serine/threonine-protein kinase
VGEPGRAPLAGRYELDALLATGGMGQVWRGRDVLLGRSVAVKILRSEYTGDPTFVARFRAEAQLAAVLRHEGIAAVHDYGEVPADEGGGEHLAYLVMELVDGESLSELLAREGRLDVARTLALLRQTAAALAAAHEAGVVHRDVKPGNVLVARDGRVALTDFGIAWSASSVPLTRTGQVVGTAHYLSPEQAEGGKAGPASDVYALGMVAYECLAGRRAFEGENAVQIALRQIREVPEPLPDDIPDAVRGLVGRMLLKDPAARFADGAAVRDAVDDVLAGRPGGAAAPGDGGTRPMAVVWPAAAAPDAVPARRPLRSRLLAPAAALVVGAALAVAGVTLLSSAAPVPVAATTEDRTGGVLLVAADHVGRPAEAVEGALAALGLRVARVPSETDRAAAGTVLALTPTGALAPGDLVTLTVATTPRRPVPSVVPAPVRPSTVAVEASAPVPSAAEPGPAPTPVPTPAPTRTSEPAPAGSSDPPRAGDASPPPRATDGGKGDGGGGAVGSDGKGGGKDKDTGKGEGEGKDGEKGTGKAKGKNRG